MGLWIAYDLQNHKRQSMKDWIRLAAVKAVLHRQEADGKRLWMSISAYNAVLDIELRKEERNERCSCDHWRRQRYGTCSRKVYGPSCHGAVHSRSPKGQRDRIISEDSTQKAGRETRIVRNCILTIPDKNT